jgi:alkanesulfonate monooxygenase SsuD/methylene tetrahydromethanopterin reductase-like flavin-dependent oxidoreductase (luciferase family)
MPDLSFGVNVSPDVDGDPIARARKAEVLGFDFISANDHIHAAGSRYELWTMLSWIASATSRIRVATRVLGVPYRPPTVVAKMAETFDRLSGGRLILGLGAGASDEEFRALGLEVGSPRDKIAGLEEALIVIRGLWAQPSFTMEGRIYRTERAEIEPKPQHYIPIWLGTLGPRGLTLTGRLGDGWIPSLENAPPDQIPAMTQRIFGAAKEAGRNAEDITLVYNLVVRVDERADEEPFVISGSPDAVCEQLRSFVKLGFTAFNFIPSGPDVDEQMERLGMDVIPSLRT